MPHETRSPPQKEAFAAPEVAFTGAVGTFMLLMYSKVVTDDHADPPNRASGNRGDLSRPMEICSHSS